MNGYEQALICSVEMPALTHLSGSTVDQVLNDHLHNEWYTTKNEVPNHANNKGPNGRTALSQPLQEHVQCSRSPLQALRGHTSVILAVGRVRMESQKFKASLSYIAGRCLKIKTQTHTHRQTDRHALYVEFRENNNWIPIIYYNLF